MARAGSKYADELRATVKAVSAPGKGILAADESTGTIGKRFAAISVDNNEENRRAYRQLLFTTKADYPGFIGGVIMFEETLFQKADDGTPFPEVLKARGVVPGIKVDKGVTPLPGCDAETATLGLDGLDKRCADYYKAGARFAKWRAVLRIDVSKGQPSLTAIQENAHGLARYAAICQENGLAPIVEPEVLMDGAHTVEQCAEATERVQAAVVKALHDQRVLLEGCFLKPNMVLPGLDCADKSSAAVHAALTVRTLQRCIPPSIGAIMFLSGGQSEEEATQHLSLMNTLDTPRPWRLSFSYGRALQQSVLKAWAGKAENVAAAQEVFMKVAEANSQATLGKYAGGKLDADSLVVKNYVY